MRTTSIVARSVVIAGCASLLAAAAGAQSFSLSPAIGLYLPTQAIIKQLAAGGTDLQKQKVGITVGGRMALWFGDRVGLEAIGAYAPSKLQRSLDGTPVADANLFTGAGRLTVNVLPPKFPLIFALSGGAALVNRSGAAYATATQKTDLGFSGGASFGIHLGKLFSFIVSADNFLYRPKFNVPTLPTLSSQSLIQKFQNDLNLSFGLGLLGLGGFGR